MTKDESIRLATDIAQIKKREKWYKRWRLFAILFLILYGATLIPKQEPDKSHIALVNIDSVITNESFFWDDLDRINSDTKAVLILMNSPGGMVGASERLYNVIHSLQSRMPVGVLVEQSATSGSYMAALGSEKIYAYNGAMIGSVGVVYSNFLLKDFLESYGIEREEVKTGLYKGYPNGYEKMPPAIRENFQELLDRTNDWFLSLVKERRQLDSLDAIRQAQVYTAEDAIKKGLIDGISTREESIAALREQVGFLPIKDLSFDEEDAFGLSKFIPRGRHAMWQMFFGMNTDSGLMAVQ